MRRLVAGLGSNEDGCWGSGEASNAVARETTNGPPSGRATRQQTGPPEQSQSRAQRTRVAVGSSACPEFSSATAGRPAWSATRETRPLHHLLRNRDLSHGARASLASRGGTPSGTHRLTPARVGSDTPVTRACPSPARAEALGSGSEWFRTFTCSWDHVRGQSRPSLFAEHGEHGLSSETKARGPPPARAKLFPRGHRATSRRLLRCLCHLQPSRRISPELRASPRGLRAATKRTSSSFKISEDDTCEAGSGWSRRSPPAGPPVSTGSACVPRSVVAVTARRARSPVSGRFPLLQVALGEASSRGVSLGTGRARGQDAARVASREAGPPASGRHRLSG